MVQVFEKAAVGIEGHGTYGAVAAVAAADLRRCAGEPREIEDVFAEAEGKADGMIPHAVEGVFVRVVFRAEGVVDDVKEGGFTDGVVPALSAKDGIEARAEADGASWPVMGTEGRGRDFNEQ